MKWPSRLLQDLHIKISRHILLHCDNQAVVHIAANPVFHECNKYREIDYHFVRDAFQAGFISLSYLRSKLQPANLFTKAHHPTQFHILMRKLGIYDLHAPT